MMDSRKIVRVFLASPSDLNVERRAAKTAVDEFNKLWAETSGYHVELVGWEDTVSRFGRPQALINQDLARCELFIGMLWRKWGTPPNKTGPYTSGFEEEYEISLRGRKSNGRPELSLFFKRVAPDVLEDPGSELKKVRDFREKVIAEKNILFEEFEDVHELEAKIRGCITNYVQRLQMDEEAKLASESQTQPAPSPKRNTPTSLSPNHVTPFSIEGAAFLRSLIDKSETEDDIGITNLDVARFRLIASLVSRSGNDEGALGVHDANLLFVKSSEFEFGRSEMFGLFECGLYHHSSENVPLWHWYEKLGGFRDPFLHFFAKIGSVEERVGAIEAMGLVGQSINDLTAGRKDLILSWLTAGAAPQIKAAALRYLSDYGTTADLPAIKAEASLTNYRTRSSAVDAVIRISLRESRESAIDALIELAPDSISERLVEQLFAHDEAIPIEKLLTGVAQPSAVVRRAVVKSLRRRKALNEAKADQLLSDPDAVVRFEALKCLVEIGRTFSDPKAILVKPVTRGILAFGMASDSEGEACYKSWATSRMERMPIDELRKEVDLSDMLSPDAYFELERREFSKTLEALRKSIDERFENEFKAFLSDIGQKFGIDAATYKQAANLEETLRQDMTRRGLDLLCNASLLEDLSRIRSALRDGYVTPSELDIAYLGRHGEWQDIPLIVDSLRQMGGRVGMLSTVSDPQFAVGARAICKIAADRIGEAARIEMPRQLLKTIVIEMSDRQAKALNVSTLEYLFSSEDDGVRKTICLRIIKSLRKAKINQLLERYLERDEQRFYNVVYWLDFGASCPKQLASRGATRELTDTER